MRSESPKMFATISILLGFIVVLQGAPNQATDDALDLKDGTQIVPLYLRDVDRRLHLPEDDQRYYAGLITDSAADNEDLRDGPPQYVLLVDRNPFVQAAVLYWKSPDGTFLYIGASPVATGKPGEFEHFETPLGIFEHTIDNPDFRAEGTVNEFGIRGYGKRGMRVFDFGWTKGTKGWGDRGESILRLQVHATDPDLLEPDLGHARSKGCIRIPATLNAFLDHYGILDADYERAMAEGKKFWVLSPSRTPTPWSGRFLVIVDSQRTARPEWSDAPRGPF